jgi:pimeloyl-ACP methyl ester carboxylesterase
MTNTMFQKYVQKSRQARAPLVFRAPDRFGSVNCLSPNGFHLVAYTDWGPMQAEEVVVCVHGLTRQGRDFDPLAARLADAGYRVICPDLVGRGQSDWLENSLNYVFPQYCADMTSLLAMIGKKIVHWIGTSLGGLIGIVLAGVPRSPIATLTVNDIGPEVALQASTRVAMRLVSDRWSFDSFEDVFENVRKVYKGCGPLTDEQWLHMARHSVRRDADTERFISLTDPKIATAFLWLWYYSMSLWKYWDELELPVLAVHGDRSDFVTPDLLAKMKRSMPTLSTFKIADTGHMPMLMSGPETDTVLSFLKSCD